MPVRVPSQLMVHVHDVHGELELALPKAILSAALWLSGPAPHVSVNAGIVGASNPYR